MFSTGQVSSGGKWRQTVRKWGAAAVVVSGLVAGMAVLARTPEPATTEPAVSLAALPPQATATHQLILRGGPFAYDKDGAVFGNRERLLPAKPRGYYREYTVETPGAPNRGARRIVCGGSPPDRPDACYYTGDHYASFRRLAQ